MATPTDATTPTTTAPPMPEPGKPFTFEVGKDIRPFSAGSSFGEFPRGTVITLTLPEPAPEPGALTPTP